MKKWVFISALVIGLLIGGHGEKSNHITVGFDSGPGPTMGQTYTAFDSGPGTVMGSSLYDSAISSFDPSETV